jgi:hypothetical protein
VPRGFAPPGAWLVRVGWTSSRPIVPDQHVSQVVVWAADEVEASLVAAQIVAAVDRPSVSGRPGCVMPTRTAVLEVRL